MSWQGAWRRRVGLLMTEAGLRVAQAHIEAKIIAFDTKGAQGSGVTLNEVRALKMDLATVIEALEVIRQPLAPSEPTTRRRPDRALKAKAQVRDGRGWFAGSKKVED